MFNTVIKILSDFTEMDPEKITMDTKLVSDLGLNSLDVVNVIVAFEDEFDIEIPDRVIKDLHTVGSIVDYLEKNV